MIYNSVEELETIGRAGARLVHDERGTRARYLSSFWLYIEKEDQAFTPHWPTGYWESWVSQWLSTQWHQNEVFIDVGANVGYFTMQAAVAGLNVLAVEPNPMLCEMLRETVKINRVGNVNIEQAAVADNYGRAVLWVPEQHSGGASIETNGEGFDVSVCPLDSLWIDDDPKRVIVKIDAEGAEPRIWKGMQDILWCHDATVLLEWHGVRYDREAFATELVKHELSVINYDGTETPIDYDWLINEPELHMICVRPNEDNL